MQKTISLVVAMDRNYAIGKANTIPWRVPGELKRFAAITTPGAVIMGRKTWESLPNGALPGRINYIITRDPEYLADGAFAFPSLDTALEHANANKDVDSIYIIGGGQVYREAMQRELPKLLYISHLIDVEVEDPDTYFDSEYLVGYEIREHETVWYDDPSTGKRLSYFAKVLAPRPKSVKTNSY